MNLTKNNNGVYVANFRAADGSRKRITTRCTTLEDAKRVTKESGIADLEMAAKAGRLTSEAIGRITTGKKLTVAQAAAHWGEWMCNIGFSRKSTRNNIWVVEKWAKDLPGIGTMPPSSITEQHISVFVNSGDSKISTRQRKLSAIRSFMVFCVAKGWRVGNPAQLVRVTMQGVPHELKETTKRKVFNNEDIHRIIADCEKRGDIFWQFAVSMSNETGMRLGDICQLEWECFNIPGHVVCWTDKRDRRVKVKISKQLESLVGQIPVTSEKYLFPEQRERVIDPRRQSYMSMVFTRMIARLGITGRSFHCIRHTTITRWAKEGKTLEDIAQDVGHADTATTAGYVHT